MSNPYQSPLSNIPLPASTTSYKTNLNRNKTQRWVNAPPVDYGGGWGDDDDLYEPPPKPVVRRSQTLADITLGGAAGSGSWGDKKEEPELERPQPKRSSTMFGQLEAVGWDTQKQQKDAETPPIQEEPVRGVRRVEGRDEGLGGGMEKVPPPFGIEIQEEVKYRGPSPVHPLPDIQQKVKEPQPEVKVTATPQQQEEEDYRGLSPVYERPNLSQKVYTPQSEDFSQQQEMPETKPTPIPSPQVIAPAPQIQSQPQPEDDDDQYDFLDSYAHSVSTFSPPSRSTTSAGNSTIPHHMNSPTALASTSPAPASVASQVAPQTQTKAAPQPQLEPEPTQPPPPHRTSFTASPHSSTPQRAPSAASSLAPGSPEAKVATASPARIIRPSDIYKRHENRGGARMVDVGRSRGGSVGPAIGRGEVEDGPRGGRSFSLTSQSQRPPTAKRADWMEDMSNGQGGVRSFSLTSASPQFHPAQQRRPGGGYEPSYNGLPPQGRARRPSQGEEGRTWSMGSQRSVSSDRGRGRGRSSSRGGGHMGWQEDFISERDGSQERSGGVGFVPPPRGDSRVVQEQQQTQQLPIPPGQQVYTQHRQQLQYPASMEEEVQPEIHQQQHVQFTAPSQQVQQYSSPPPQPTQYYPSPQEQQVQHLQQQPAEPPTPLPVQHIQFVPPPQETPTQPPTTQADDFRTAVHSAFHRTNTFAPETLVEDVSRGDSPIMTFRQPPPQSAHPPSPPPAQLNHQASVAPTIASPSPPPNRGSIEEKRRSTPIQIPVLKMPESGVIADTTPTPDSGKNGKNLSIKTSSTADEDDNDDELSAFIGELVRANTPTSERTLDFPPPPSAATSSGAVTPKQINPTSPNLAVPQPQPQQQQRESVGVFSDIYDSYLDEYGSTSETEAEMKPLETVGEVETPPLSPPPLMPKSPLRQTPSPRVSVQLEQQPAVEKKTTPPPAPIITTSPPLTNEEGAKREKEPDTPSTIAETPDLELMNLLSGAANYLERAPTLDSIHPSQSIKPIPPTISTTFPVQTTTSNTATPTASSATGPPAEGIEVISGPTIIPKPEKTEEEKERELEEEDYTRELMAQFSRPQTLMLKHTMPGFGLHGEGGRGMEGLPSMPPIPKNLQNNEERAPPEAVNWDQDDEEKEVNLGPVAEKKGDESRPVSPPDAKDMNGATIAGTLAPDADVGGVSPLPSRPTTAKSQDSKSAPVPATTMPVLDPHVIAALPTPRERATAYDNLRNNVKSQPEELKEWYLAQFQLPENKDLLTRTIVEVRAEAQHHHHGGGFGSIGSGRGRSGTVTLGSLGKRNKEKEGGMTGGEKKDGTATGSGVGGNGFVGGIGIADGKGREMLSKGVGKVSKLGGWMKKVKGDKNKDTSSATNSPIYPSQQQSPFGSVTASPASSHAPHSNPFKSVVNLVSHGRKGSASSASLLNRPNTADAALSLPSQSQQKQQQQQHQQSKRSSQYGMDAIPRGSTDTQIWNNASNSGGTGSYRPSIDTSSASGRVGEYSTVSSTVSTPIHRGGAGFGHHSMPLPSPIHNLTAAPPPVEKVETNPPTPTPMPALGSDAQYPQNNNGDMDINNHANNSMGNMQFPTPSTTVPVWAAISGDAHKHSPQHTHTPTHVQAAAVHAAKDGEPQQQMKLGSPGIHAPNDTTSTSPSHGSPIQVHIPPRTTSPAAPDVNYDFPAPPSSVPSRSVSSTKSVQEENKKKETDTRVSEGLQGFANAYQEPAGAKTITTPIASITPTILTTTAETTKITTTVTSPTNSLAAAIPLPTSPTEDIETNDKATMPPPPPPATVERYQEEEDDEHDTEALPPPSKVTSPPAAAPPLVPQQQAGKFNPPPSQQQQHEQLASSSPGYPKPAVPQDGYPIAVPAQDMNGNAHLGLQSIVDAHQSSPPPAPQQQQQAPANPQQHQQQQPYPQTRAQQPYQTPPSGAPTPGIDRPPTAGSEFSFVPSIIRQQHAAASERVGSISEDTQYSPPAPQNHHQTPFQPTHHSTPSRSNRYSYVPAPLGPDGRPTSPYSAYNIASASAAASVQVPVGIQRGVIGPDDVSVASAGGSRTSSVHAPPTPPPNQAYVNAGYGPMGPPSQRVEQGTGRDAGRESVSTVSSGERLGYGGGMNGAGPGRMTTGRRRVVSQQVGSAPGSVGTQSPPSTSGHSAPVPGGVQFGPLSQQQGQFPPGHPQAAPSNWQQQGQSTPQHQQQQLQPPAQPQHPPASPDSGKREKKRTSFLGFSSTPSSQRQPSPSPSADQEARRDGEKGGKEKKKSGGLFGGILGGKKEGKDKGEHGDGGRKRGFSLGGMMKTKDTPPQQQQVVRSPQGPPGQQSQQPQGQRPGPPPPGHFPPGHPQGPHQQQYQQQQQYQPQGPSRDPSQPPQNLPPAHPQQPPQQRPPQKQSPPPQQQQSPVMPPPERRSTGLSLLSSRRPSQPAVPIQHQQPKIYDPKTGEYITYEEARARQMKVYQSVPNVPGYIPPPVTQMPPPGEYVPPGGQEQMSQPAAQPQMGMQDEAAKSTHITTAVTGSAPGNPEYGQQQQQVPVDRREVRTPPPQLPPLPDFETTLEKKNSTDDFGLAGILSQSSGAQRSQGQNGYAAHQQYQQPHPQEYGQPAQQQHQQVQRPQMEAQRESSYHTAITTPSPPAAVSPPSAPGQSFVVGDAGFFSPQHQQQQQYKGPPLGHPQKVSTPPTVQTHRQQAPVQVLRESGDSTPTSQPGHYQPPPALQQQHTQASGVQHYPPTAPQKQTHEYPPHPVAHPHQLPPQQPRQQPTIQQQQLQRLQNRQSDQERMAAQQRALDAERLAKQKAYEAEQQRMEQERIAAQKHAQKLQKRLSQIPGSQPSHLSSSQQPGVNPVPQPNQRAVSQPPPNSHQLRQQPPPAPVQNSFSVRPRPSQPPPPPGAPPIIKTIPPTRESSVAHPPSSAPKPLTNAYKNKPLPDPTGLAIKPAVEQPGGGIGVYVEMEDTSNRIKISPMDEKRRRKKYKTVTIKEKQQVKKMVRPKKSVGRQVFEDGEWRWKEEEVEDMEKEMVEVMGEEEVEREVQVSDGEETDSDYEEEIVMSATAGPMQMGGGWEAGYYGY